MFLSKTDKFSSVFLSFYNLKGQLVAQIPQVRTFLWKPFEECGLGRPSFTNFKFLVVFWFLTLLCKLCCNLTKYLPIKVNKYNVDKFFPTIYCKGFLVQLIMKLGVYFDLSLMYDLCKKLRSIVWKYVKGQGL